MAKRESPAYTCTAVFTEGCSQRLTEALVDIYYNRLKGISQSTDQEPQEDQEPA